MSDPFQPIERKYGYSLACLKLLADTQYPFVFSTKGTLITESPYIDILRNCNAAAQVSLVSPQYDGLESGAAKFETRLAILEPLAKAVKRLIVRIQPYVLGLLDDILANIPRYASSGVYGVAIEGMKRTVKREGWVKVGGDWCYPVDSLRADFEQIKSAAHANGLTFFAAENRLRAMGDNPCCCGVNGIDGWRVNTANLNHLRDGITYTPRMKEPRSAYPMRSISQSTIFIQTVDEMKYCDAMDIVKRTKFYLRAMGYLPE